MQEPTAEINKEKQVMNIYIAWLVATSLVERLKCYKVQLGDINRDGLLKVPVKSKLNRFTLIAHTTSLVVNN